MVERLANAGGHGRAGRARLKVAVMPGDSWWGRSGKRMVAAEDDAAIRKCADDVIAVPRTDELLSPVVAILPLQLLAYDTACALDLDIDQPRNLAKSVTVE